MKTINSGKITVLAVLVLGALGGCNRAESPQKTANDVAEARQDAAQDNRDAARDAARDVARDSANGAPTEKSEYDQAVTRAEGDHKVAIEKCEAMSGEQQKACKSRADADLETAKANAKSAYPNQ